MVFSITDDDDDDDDEDDDDDDDDDDDYDEVMFGALAVKVFISQYLHLPMSSLQ